MARFGVFDFTEKQLQYIRLLLSPQGTDRGILAVVVAEVACPSEQWVLGRVQEAVPSRPLAPLAVALGRDGAPTPCPLKKARLSYTVRKHSAPVASSCLCRACLEQSK